MNNYRQFVEQEIKNRNVEEMEQKERNLRLELEIETLKTEIAKLRKPLPSSPEVIGERERGQN